jgi:pimeloyl-ACP methyl ester carboxylesterase
MMMLRLFLAALALAFACSAPAQSAHPGVNSLTVRGQAQEIYYYPARGTGPHRSILFAGGDGGWHGFAVTIAESMAAAGFHVYGLNARRYLMSFTGSSGLTPELIARDYRQIADWIRGRGTERILLAGWSEGAGLGLAAAADSSNQQVFEGLVAIGMTEYNILALRWSDFGALVIKRLPNEPTFKSSDFVAKVSPLPLALIASRRDAYVSPEATQKLFAAARDPKRLVFIDADDHKFAGHTGEFFRTLNESLNWLMQSRK